ncbi:MAG: hypothetical protein GC149_15735 [Gammaproteobacteria bacterium]|nr:hypothetical protein [Gammaproteobacteria bacterium]
MSRPGTLPSLPRHDSAPVITPMVPLNFVYPGLSLSQIFSIIRGYWKISLIIVTVVLALTVVVLKVLPRMYTAEVTLMVNYEVNDPLNGKELPINQLGNYIATQIELLRNQELLSEVVDKLNLTANQDYAKGYTGKTGTLKQWVIEQLGKDLTVYQGQFGSQLIYVRFSANNPYLAAKVANTIAEIYKAQDDKRAVSEPVERSARFAQQLSELKTNVDLAQQKVTDFRKQHNLLDDNKGDVDVVLLSTLEGRLLEARNQRRIAEARAMGDPSATDSVLGSQEIQALKARLADQELQLVKLESRYTPEHPDLVDLKAYIAATQKSLADAVKKYSANGQEELNVAKQLEKSLEVAVAKQRAKVLANGKLQDEATKYVLALKSAQDAYKRALDDYDKLKFSSSNHKSNVNFISRATPPLKYSKPKIFKGLLLGAVVAFVLGLGLPVGYELFNRRVRCRDDLERDYGIPVLAEFGASSMRATA